PTTPPTTRKPGPVRDSQGFHVVNRGDTLYSIAWNYGFDFRDVATWNGINAPYLIYPGQVIRLKPSAVTEKKVLQPGPVVNKTQDPGPVVEAPAVKTPEKQPPQKIVQNKQAASTAAGQTDEITWRWPVHGEIIKSGSLTSKKGVDIGGRLGQDIRAAAQGDVVYSGSGLLGYGRLIIIKHNETYLSAYAHNSELLVKEGDSVSKGQVIAKMGTNSTGRAQLHFEIRKNGKSVNPLKFLPKS
ncbi:MAG: peptidoglycan DD-metalloendopeptidase family protein, partial [Gammaproteobacteria bacterium]|nr:peptidoglycan DD-metalloendopeptidase family protein [Gammaproteobacteria bacterium]